MLICGAVLANRRQLPRQPHFKPHSEWGKLIFSPAAKAGTSSHESPALGTNNDGFWLTLTRFAGCRCSETTYRMSLAGQSLF